MRRFPLSLILLFGFGGLNASATSIFLNGADVSGARNQRLKGVNLFIDEVGNVFIDAPHYAVNEQAQYIPLSPQMSRQKPAHQRPVGLPAHPEAPAADEQELQNPKAGSKMPAADAPASAQPPSNPNDVGTPAENDVK